MKALLRYLPLFFCLFALAACQQADKETASSSSPSTSKSEPQNSSSSTSTSQSEASSTTSTSESYTAPSSTPASSSAPAVASMDVTALQNQDYTSIAGTWKDAQGNTFVFDANGLVDDHYEVTPGHKATITDSILTASYMPKASPVGSGVIKFAPKGSVFPTGVDGLADASDSTRDRIWMGQQNVFSNADNFYYRVE